MSYNYPPRVSMTELNTMRNLNKSMPTDKTYDDYNYDSGKTGLSASLRYAKKLRETQPNDDRRGSKVNSEELTRNVSKLTTLRYGPTISTEPKVTPHQAVIDAAKSNDPNKSVSYYQTPLRMPPKGNRSDLLGHPDDKFKSSRRGGAKFRPRLSRSRSLRSRSLRSRSSRRSRKNNKTRSRRTR